MTVLPAAHEPQHTGGRRSRLTRETADLIVGAIEQGSYIKIAAQAAGIGQSTLAGWLARGREAASARDRHEPDRRYCPDCDTDREDEVRSLDEANRREEELYTAALQQWQQRDTNTDRADGDDPYGEGEERPLPPGTAVLDRCPSCRSDAYPIPWTLPDTEAPYLEFLESVTRAQATAEVDAVAAWRRAFTGHEPDWRAARDYLARTAPERWAGVTRVQMTTEEAERRIDDAVNEALLAVGVDLPDGDLLDGLLDEGLDA